MHECPNPIDIELNAELQVAERLFKIEAIAETPQVQHEQDVRRIATSLFLMFFDPDERDEILYGPRWKEPVVEAEYCSKAEKIYNVAGDYDSAKKIVRFLQIIDSTLAKQIVQKL